MGSRAASAELIELGERIRRRRQSLHWSQELLAEKADISLHTVCRIEGGQTAMSVRVFRKMAEVLGMDAGELLGEEGTENNGDVSWQDVASRISRLNKSDQEIVLQTMDTLIRGLDGRR